MAGNIERDAFSGVETTGHEWDGLKELNNPLPKWWLYLFYACIAWSVLYWVVYPAWPIGKTYTAGIAGYSSRADVEKAIADAKAVQAPFLNRIKAASVDQIRAEPDLLNFALIGGRALFADNCAGCHGAGGQGQAGYPVLADDDWLWGGTAQAIYQTIQYGIRSGHADARINTMPEYGAGLLTPQQIVDVTEHVLVLAKSPADTAAAQRGAAVFAEQCVVCHGDAGGGNADLGAPNLTDSAWLHGGSRTAIHSQITHPKHGVMPAWSPRLDDTTVKLLAVFVHELGGGQ